MVVVVAQCVKGWAATHNNPGSRPSTGKREQTGQQQHGTNQGGPGQHTTPHHTTTRDHTGCWIATIIPTPSGGGDDGGHPAPSSMQKIPPTTFPGKTSFLQLAQAKTSLLQLHLNSRNSKTTKEEDEQNNLHR